MVRRQAASPLRRQEVLISLLSRRPRVAPAALVAGSGLWMASAGNAPLWRELDALGVFGQPGGWPLAVALGLMIASLLVALLSLFVRWGALPLAIVVMAPITMCCPVGQLLFLVAGRPGTRDPAGALAATITVWILMGLVCFVFQMMIAARIQELSSKG